MIGLYFTPILRMAVSRIFNLRYASMHSAKPQHTPSRTVSTVLVSAFLALGIAWTAPAVAASDAASGQYSINSPIKVEERTSPSAKVCVEGDTCGGGAAAAPAAAAAEPAAPATRDPQTVFNTGCAACHASGAAGAPKPGDKAAWAPRIAEGKDTLHQHALHGFKGMPARGLCGSGCTDEEIMGVVDWMVSQSE
ncbi:Cytochrome c, class IE [gamma proteobacterium HdN1]|nr:Cytochrome c, class IE [gamma proteobacterium HdN1]